METDILILHFLVNYLLNYTFKKFFYVLYQFSLRKHYAKAVSSGFFNSQGDQGCGSWILVKLYDVLVFVK